MADKAPTLAEVEQESAHDSILAVMAEAVGEPITDADLEGAEPAPEAPQETKTEPQKAEGQERDEFGRFKAKAAEEAPAETAEQPPAETPAAEGVDAPEPIEPPTEWKAAEQDEFRKLTRPAQEFLLAQYNNAKEQATRASQASGKYAALDQMLAPRRDALARDGLDETGYLRYLINLSDSASRDAPGFIRWFAQQRQLTPQQIFGQPQGQPGQPQPAADPYIAQLEQKLGRFENYMHQQAQAAEQARVQSLSNEISSFGSAKDAKGKLAHPYFEEVRSHMGALMRSELASDLQSAYDMACRAHPEVSAKIASAERARAEQERALEQRKKAEAARKAGSSISGTPGDRSSPPPSGDLREDLRRQFAERGLIT